MPLISSRKSIILSLLALNVKLDLLPMFKVIGLIVAGVFLLAFGIYFLSIAELPPFNIHFPNVNWAIVGFVVIAGSIVSFGTAFITTRLH